MTETNHPVTPPPELRWLWTQQAQRMDQQDPVAWVDYVSTQAACWGADTELEACCDYIGGTGKWFGSPEYRLAELRAARRPKPPSVKQQALKELDLLKADARSHGLGFDAPAIRRALEELPDD